MIEFIVTYWVLGLLIIAVGYLGNLTAKVMNGD